MRARMRGRLLGVVVVLLLTAYIVPVAAAAEPLLADLSGAPEKGVCRSYP